MRERWQRHMAINLRAPLVLTQGLLAQLPAAGEANVVNLIDAAGAQPHPALHLLHGLEGGALGADPASRAARSRRGCGSTRSRRGRCCRTPAMSEEAFAALCRATPLGRGPSVEEICRALRLILEAPAMTGQMITLDGGRHLGWLLPASAIARADGLTRPG